MLNPKVFISYSWSSPQHEEWVLNLAKELCDNGVDTILDKWNLKEGHDAHSFMEKMVNDPDIKKVLIISDKIYTEKANKRVGGAGTEAQIISSELYNNVAQEKFVAVVTEKDDNGKAFLPTYYSSRIYIDFCESNNYTDSFEKLLRWIYDKPVYVKPPIGNPPCFLDDTADNISLGTSYAFKRVITGFKESKPYADGALDEYLTILSTNLELFRISKPSNGYYDDLMIDNINKFIPYRNEFIQVFITICQYGLTNSYLDKYHLFFESLLPYFKRRPQCDSWHESDFDNFKFIAHELFLYFAAILLKYEKFSQLNDFLTVQFYEQQEESLDPMKGYYIFCPYLESLQIRNQRSTTKYCSLQATLLHDRVSIISLWELMQADFCLFLRSELIPNRGWNCDWYPTILLYSDFNGRRPFEIFARAKSQKYFSKVKCILGVISKREIEALMDDYWSGAKKLPRWDHVSFNPKFLLAFDTMATIP